MNKTVKNALLWITVIPASLAGMILASLLWRIIHILTTARYLDLNSWFNIIMVEVVSNIIAGAVFVFIGYKIAPNNKKTVAIILVALLIVLAGSSFFIVNFITKEYFTNIGIISAIFGSIVCYISIYKGEFDKS
ncbi:hypothetical protein KJ885_05200 [Patescibacteria group bacterium]|nr:hypothetical protein [Patescibacteria group bacterium]